MGQSIKNQNKMDSFYELSALCAQNALMTWPILREDYQMVLVILYVDKKVSIPKQQLKHVVSLCGVNC